MIVATDLSSQNIHISLIPESGLAPFETTLTISSDVALQDSSVNFSGPQAPTIIENSTESYDIELTGAGLYFITVQAWDDQDIAYTDTVAVQAWDRNALDGLLQAKWSAVKAYLLAGNIDGALNYFDQGTKPIFEYNFNALHDHLEEVVAGLKSATLVKAVDNLAEYNLVGEQNGQEFSFYLLFEKDGQGVWRLKFF